MPALFLGALVAGCVWCCTRQEGDRTHPATMLANFKRGLKRVKREFRSNHAPQDEFSYHYSRARNQLVDHGMSRRQAVRLLDKVLDEFAADPTVTIATLTGKQLAERAYEIRDRGIPGSLPDKAHFITNGRGSFKRRGTAGSKGAKGPFSAELKRAINQGVRDGIPRKALEKAARETRKNMAARGLRLPQTTREWYGEITSEDWLDARYRQEVINGRNIGSEYERAHGGKKRNWRNTNPFPKGRKRQRRNGHEDDPDMVARPGSGPPSRVPGKYAFDDPAKRAHRHGVTVSFERTPFDPYTDTIDMVKYRHERAHRRLTTIPEFDDYAKLNYRTDFWKKQAEGEPTPKKRKARKNGRRWNDQDLTGHSWSTSRTPDGGSVTVHRDASGRVVERDVLSGKQHALKMKGVRARMSKRSSGAVAILVRQGVSKAAAKRAVDFVGADSSDTAGELASRARIVLGGGGRLRRPKQWKFREPSTMGPRKGGSRRSRRNGRSYGKYEYHMSGGETHPEDVLQEAAAILAKKGWGRQEEKFALRAAWSANRSAIGKKSPQWWAKTAEKYRGAKPGNRPTTRARFSTRVVRHKPMSHRRAAKRRRNRGRR